MAPNVGPVMVPRLGAILTYPHFKLIHNYTPEIDRPLENVYMALTEFWFRCQTYKPILK